MENRGRRNSVEFRRNNNNRNYQPYRRDNRNQYNNNRRNYSPNRRNYDRSPQRRRNYSPNQRGRGGRSTRGRGYYPSKNKFKDSVLDYYRDNRANEKQILMKWIEALELNLKVEDVFYIYNFLKINPPF